MLRKVQNQQSAKAILERIDRRMEALRTSGMDVTDRSISLLGTKSADTIRSIRRNMENGKQRGVSTETLRKLAAPLQTTGEWLASGSGPETSDSAHVESSQVAAGLEGPRERKTKIVGYVGAASGGVAGHLYAYAQEEFEEVISPEFATEQTVAVVIKGKSFGALLESWLVYYDDVRSPVTEDLYNEVCVVGLSDDRILVKKVVKRADGGIDLLSNTDEPPIHDVIVEWAAKVKAVAPRLG